MFRNSQKNRSLVTLACTDDVAPHEVVMPRAPQFLVSLLADNSGSMEGESVQQVNQGIADVKQQWSNDPMTRESVQLQLVTFGGSVNVRSYAPITRFVPPALTAGGGTPLAEALLAAVAGTQQYAEHLRRIVQVDVLKPRYFIFTDGAPTSPDATVREMAVLVRAAERERKAEFHAFGTDSTAVQRLQPLFPRQVHLLGGQNFADFFKIISVSVRVVSGRSVHEDFDITPIIKSHLQLPYLGDADA